MKEQYQQAAAQHRAILEGSLPALIKQARDAYGHPGKGVLQLFYSEPRGYSGTAGVIYHPAESNFEALLASKAGSGPATHDELFDYDEKRTMAVCITYAGDNFFYRIDLPPDAPPFDRAPVN